MIPRLIIAFVVVCVLYIKYPLTLCLSYDPTFMIGEFWFYSSVFFVYVIFEVIYSVRGVFLKRRNIKNLNGTLDNLQGAVESMIAEDYKEADKYLDKTEKIVGEDSVIVNWIRGCNKLYSNNTHEAKAKFYQAAYSEKSILGGYSLYKLAEVEGNDKDAYDALKQITLNVKHVPSSILRNIIKFQFMNKEFNDARENIKKLKDRRLLGISYYLENSTTLDNLKLAFENVKDIPDIAIAYARKLLFLEEFRKARKVIMESWKASHSPELFKFFVSVNQEDDISVAKKFLKSMSFEGSSEFALLLYSKGMYPIAYKYFKDAFAMYPTSKILFYINELREKLGKYDDRIMREESIVDESIVFDDPSWTCTSCNHKMNKWIAICPYCNSLDTVRWLHHEKNSQQNKIEKVGNDVLLSIAPTKS